MFGQKKTTRRRRISTSTTQFEKLEDRNLMASIHFDAPTGQLYIAGDAASNTATLTQLNDTTYRARVDNVTRDVAVSEVNGINFLGYGGDDAFTNNTSAEVTAYGHAGNDTLRGGSGADALIGGSGNDTIYGNNGADRLVGANGNDTIFGGNGDDLIFGSTGSNELNGGNGDDTIFGSNTGDDILKGDNGRDQLFGLGGDDELHSGAGGSIAGGGELLMGHAGADRFFGGPGLNLLWGGDGDDVMTGTGGIQRMHGQNGNDTLTGGTGADLLRGHAGNDTITGNAGNDAIDAGSGSGDVVRFTKSYAASTVSATANGQRASVVSDGAEEIIGAERLQFSDRTISSNQATLAAPEAANLSTLNSYRSSSSRSVLSTPSDLTTFAENWSRTMGRNNRLEHSSSASRRALLVDGRTTVGENIIFIQDTGQSDAAIAAAMHNAWRNSASHRANMLNGSFSEVGIGIVKVGGFWWGTQVFAG